MDDIILTGSDPSFFQHLINTLNHEFDIKDLGNLHYFLGLEIFQTDHSIFINQEKYTRDILHTFGMSECKPCSTPASTKLCKNEGQLLSDPTDYRRAVGALQYLTFTRPYISFSVNTVCQYMHQPTTSHFSPVKRIFRYLKGTVSQGLLYQPSTRNLLAYSDADWVGDPVDWRSVTGLFF